MLLSTQACASKHPNPTAAPEGQGEARLLIEDGGIVADLNTDFFYLGRYVDVELGNLADSSKEVPDAHQTLMPPLVGGSIFVEIGDMKEAFAVYFIGHKQTASTDSAAKAKIPHTASVYPVSYLQGRALKDAFIIGFEESTNGDYQDGVFLIENIKVALNLKFKLFRNCSWLVTLP